MHKMSFGADDFDIPSAENSLELALASLDEYDTLEMFLVACEIRFKKCWHPTADYDRWPEITHYLQKFARVDLGQHTVSRVLVMSDERNRINVAFETDELYIWFNWWTTV